MAFAFHKFVPVSAIFIWLLLGNCESAQNESKSKAETVILISMAGLGWKFVGSNLSHTPNFDFIASTGVKARNMLSVNPTKTAPVHTTFMTGLYPESHGVVDNMFWDPVYKERFIHSDDCSNFDSKFYNDSEPLWVTMQKRGQNTAAYFWPGSYSYAEKPTYSKKPVCYVNCSLYTGKRLEYLRSYMRVHCTFDWSDPFANRVDKILEWLKSDAPPRLVLLYIDEPDWKGHAYGANSKQYREMVEKIDKDVIGRLIDGLWSTRLLEKVNIILVSDYSLIETSNYRQIRLNSYTPSTNYYEGRSTGGQIWPKPGRLEEIYTAIKTGNNSHLKIYKKEDIPEEFHWQNHRRIPPLYLVVEEGWLVRDAYDAAGEGEWTEGSHVWPPSQNSAGIFYARGPAFKDRYYCSRTVRAVDIYPLLCHILGIEPRAHNGSLSNMREFFRVRTDVSRNQIKNSSGHAVTPTTVPHNQDMGYSVSVGSEEKPNTNLPYKGKSVSGGVTIEPSVTTVTTPVISTPKMSHNPITPAKVVTQEIFQPSKKTAKHEPATSDETMYMYSSPFTKSRNTMTSTMTVTASATHGVLPKVVVYRKEGNCGNLNGATLNATLVMLLVAFYANR